MLTLELRALLARAKEQAQELSGMQFVRMAWRSSDCLAVESGRLAEPSCASCFA